MATILVGYFPSYRRRAGHQGYPLSQIVAGCLGTNKSCFFFWTRATPIPMDYVSSSSSTVKIPLWILHFRTNQDIRYHIEVCYTLQYSTMISKISQWIVICNHIESFTIYCNDGYSIFSRCKCDSHCIPQLPWRSLVMVVKTEFRTEAHQILCSVLPGKQTWQLKITLSKTNEDVELVEKSTTSSFVFLKGPDKVFQYLC
jgi:hypothetical protein